MKQGADVTMSVLNTIIVKYMEGRFEGEKTGPREINEKVVAKTPMKNDGGSTSTVMAGLKRTK